jgi:hypothetical protein
MGGRDDTLEQHPIVLELDHLFACTRVGASEGDALVALGLTEGTSNVHPGQGTTNRRIFFRNAMLEFLWVIDEDEARSSVIAPTRLWERWRYRDTGYSPFGIAFRPRSGQSAPSTTWPFATWAYRPPYLPRDLEISVASNMVSAEPLVFVIPFGGRQDSLPPEQRQPLDHAIGFREITSVRITVPDGRTLSDAVRELHESGLIAFRGGDDHLAEIEFDKGQAGQVIDMRPGLPLQLRW